MTTKIFDIEKNETCPDCGEEMEVFRYGEGSTPYWRCSACLKFGKEVKYKV